MAVITFSQLIDEIGYSNYGTGYSVADHQRKDKGRHGECDKSYQGCLRDEKHLFADFRLRREIGNQAGIHDVAYHRHFVKNGRAGGNDDSNANAYVVIGQLKLRYQ